MSTNAVNSTDHSNSDPVLQTGMIIAHDNPTLRLSATSMPIRAEKPPGSGTMAGGIGYYPKPSQFEHLSDDEIMVVPVTVTKTAAHHHQAAGGETHGFMSKIKGLVSSSEKEMGGKLRIVYMPRREYLKYFAKDDKRYYVGSEPQRSWTDEELDEMFGQFEPPPLSPKSKPSLTDLLLTPLGVL